MKSIDSWLKCESYDIKEFIRALYEIASKKGLVIVKLAQIKKYPILILTPSKINKGPNLLIAAGFHGEECGGPWGILHFLQTCSNSILEKANVSFLPLVNPTGFAKGKRENYLGEVPNTDYIHTIKKIERSQEDLFLLKNIKLLKKLAKQGFLSLHEDQEHSKFYLFSFENSEVPSSFSKRLVTTGSKFFRVQNGKIKYHYSDGTIDESSVDKGIVFKKHDGTFEDLLFHEGVPRAICTETPAFDNIDKRIKANSEIIKSFVKHSIIKL